MCSQEWALTSAWGAGTKRCCVREEKYWETTLQYTTSSAVCGNNKGMVLEEVDLQFQANIQQKRRAGILCHSSLWNTSALPNSWEVAVCGSVPPYPTAVEQSRPAQCHARWSKHNKLFRVCVYLWGNVAFQISFDIIINIWTHTNKKAFKT